MAAPRVEAFIIHLERATQRRPQVDKLLSRLPVPARVVDAADGAKLDEATACSVYRRNIHQPHYPFELRQTEIACFLSHRKCWQEIVDRDLDAGLIVEDDVEPDDQLFAKTLKLALSAMRPADYIRFPYRSHTDTGREVAAADGIAVVEPAVVGLGMQMQLVGRDAAAALLETTKAFDRPVDTTIQMRWLTPARILAVKPPVIREISAAVGGTVVQKKSKPLGETLSRDIKRALYRLRVRLASSRNRLGPGEASR